MSPRAACRTFLAAAVLCAASLVAAPVWDFWHYRRPEPPLGRKTSPALAVGSSRAAGTAPGDDAGGGPDDAPMAARLTPSGSPISEDAAWTAAAPAAIEDPATENAPRTASGVDASSLSAASGPAASPAPWVDDDPEGSQGGARSGVLPMEASAEPSFYAAISAATESVDRAAPPASLPSPAAPAARPAGGGSGAGSRSRPDPVPASTRLRLVPGASSIAAGDTVDVQVMLEDSQTVSSVPFHVRFDPEVVDFVAAHPGAALGAAAPILMASVAPERPDDLAVGLAMPGAGFLSDGAILVLRFIGKRAGSSAISFDRAAVRGLDAAPAAVLLEHAVLTVR